jgi:alkanesulfonate monooxygenase SsuD/methylene tetrahydromethanopterin reductase-like flavin-dependent oxidoreductase (luciferase family)
MRFSFFSLLDVYDTQAHTSAAIYQQTLKQIVLADELGFDAYWIGEHHGAPTPNQVLACPNPALLLAAAAQLTHRIGLNTAVANLSLRHPLQVAEDYALVDVLSQGRLGLGIGRGSFPYEYAARTAFDPLYLCVTPTHSEALHTAVDALRRYMEQQHPSSHEHIMHTIHHDMWYQEVFQLQFHTRCTPFLLLLPYILFSCASLYSKILAL